MVRKKSQKGFSLIEVLVAIVILAVGMLGTAALITGIVRGNQTSSSVTTATTLAQDKMEQMIKSGYNGISSTTITTTENYGSITGYANYKRVTTVTVGSPAARMKTVSVSVHWQTGTNPVTLTTIIAR